MKIMFDTNVLISAALFKGKLLQIVSKTSNEHKMVICSAIIDEFLCVIDRKFPDKKKYADKFLYELDYIFVQTPKSIKEDAFPNIRAKKDYPILASAIIADTDIFITGDKDFRDISIKRPKILTPKEYAENYMII